MDIIALRRRPQRSAEEQAQGLRVSSGQPQAASRVLFFLEAVCSPVLPERTWQPPPVTQASPAGLKAAVTLNGPLQVYTPDCLHQLMSESHYVVAALPSTPETKGYISAEAIASMRSDAVFINIGRGKTVDEEALIKGQNSLMLTSAA